MSRASLFVPLAAFILLAGLLYAAFFLSDPHDLPSALLGKPFPTFDLPGLNDAPKSRYTAEDIRGRVMLVNVWATWCPTCRAEHEELLKIGKESGLAIVGINYKDDSDQARQWLERLGNPYEFNIVDQDGRLGVDLGVYAAPESFLVDTTGTIVYKCVGEVSRSVWEREIKPRIDALAAQAPARG